MAFKKREFRPWKPALLETAEEENIMMVEKPSDNPGTVYPDLGLSLEEPIFRDRTDIENLTTNENHRILIGGFLKPTNIFLLNNKTKLAHQNAEENRLEAEKRTLDALNQVELISEQISLEREARTLAESKAQQAIEYAYLGEERSKQIYQEKSLAVEQLFQNRIAELEALDRQRQEEATEALNAIQEPLRLSETARLTLQTELDTTLALQAELRQALEQLEERLTQQIEFNNKDRKAAETQITEITERLSKINAIAQTEKFLRKLAEEKNNNLTKTLELLEAERIQNSTRIHEYKELQNSLKTEKDIRKKTELKTIELLKKIEQSDLQMASLRNLKTEWEDKHLKEAESKRKVDDKVLELLQQIREIKALKSTEEKMRIAIETKLTGTTTHLQETEEKLSQEYLFRKTFHEKHKEMGNLLEKESAAKIMVETQLSDVLQKLQKTEEKAKVMAIKVEQENAKRIKDLQTNFEKENNLRLEVEAKCEEALNICAKEKEARKAAERTIYDLMQKNREMTKLKQSNEKLNKFHPPQKPSTSPEEPNEA